MKKLLKLFICFILFASAFTFAACGGDDETPEERRLRLYDYNASGVVDEWEEPFEEKAVVNTIHPIAGYEIVEISSMDIFKASILDENKSNKIYKLTTDLDFREEKKEDFRGVIDLGGAYLYGNGKTITCLEPYKLDASGQSLSEFALFKNAKGIYDLTVYLGCVDGTERAASKYSVFRDVETIDNVRVKGRLELNVGSGTFEIAGLTIGNFKEITNSIVDCDVVLTNPENLGAAELNLKFGGVVCENPYGSEIKNCETEITFDGNYNSASTLGGIAAVNNGFIEECNADFDFKYTTYQSNKTQIGGISGSLGYSGEIKNSVAEVDGEIVDNEKSDVLYGDVAVGGIAGVSYGSLFYNESDGDIKVKNIATINVGGFVGVSKDSYILRNISKVDITVSRAMKMFVANFAGSAEGGIIESCIGNGDVDVTLDFITEDIKSKNIGLFFFNSNNFLVTNPEDEFLTLNIAENVIAPKNSPSLYKNILRGNTSITSVATEEVEETDEVINSMVNYGGYWWWIRRNGESQPRLFLGSNCSGASITINERDRTNSFFPDQDHSTAWLKNSNINIATQLKDFGLLSTEINSANASSFDDLRFYNPASQMGSYYQSEDQLVKDNAYCDGDNYFDHRVDTLYELTSISKYYKDSDKKRHLTFVVDKDMVSANYGDDFDSSIIQDFFNKTYGEIEGEDVNKKYYLYSQAVKDTLLGESSELKLNDILDDMESLSVSDIEKIIICVIIEIANSKVQIYTDENNLGFVNLSYKVGDEETQRYYSLDVVSEGDFYRVSLFF